MTSFKYGKKSKIKTKTNEQKKNKLNNYGFTNIQQSLYKLIKELAKVSFLDKQKINKLNNYGFTNIQQSSYKLIKELAKVSFLAPSFLLLIVFFHRTKSQFVNKKPHHLSVLNL